MPIVKFRGDYSTFFRPSSTPFKDLIEEASWRGTEVERINGDGQITVTDVRDLDITTYMAIVGAGMTVEGFPVWIKMSTATYAAAVPSGIPNRSYVDGQGNTVIRDWDEWKADGHEHMDAEDGDKIVPGNSWGTELTGAEAKILHDAAGYTLLTAVTLSDELPDPQDP